ncbi:Hypothetical predicted protein [Pelobates cultripes]|uniref:Uncharacterized protein n=1 Tax=Pelobates cultripes TaxID=61616 RepID=A0AAD1RL60_PELCU|nr:Hypothetical predicted protein [Pelobates cultripes]
MSQRLKAKASKANQASFFLVRASVLKAREGLGPTQDGTDTLSREGSPTSISEDGPLTATTMRAMMAEFYTSIQASIQNQIQALTKELRREVQDIGHRAA